MKVSKRIIARRDRINWLIAQKDRWAGFPASWRDMKQAHHDLHREMVREMQLAGLVSPKTNWRDINIIELIREARAWMRRK